MKYEQNQQHERRLEKELAEDILKFRLGLNMKIKSLIMLFYLFPVPRKLNDSCLITSQCSLAIKNSLCNKLQCICPDKHFETDRGKLCHPCEYHHFSFNK